MDHYTTKDRVMVAHVPTHRVSTVYSAVGDWFGWLSVIGFVGMAGWAILRRNKVNITVEKEDAKGISS